MNILAEIGQDDWLFIAIFIVGLYSIILLPLKDSESWRKRGITTWGLIPAVFIRTTRGLTLLDKLAGPKWLWRAVATLGVPLVLASMLYFLAMVMLMAYLVVLSPPEPSPYNAPRNILLIPGVNQFVPLVWGWVGLIVTMVVHEFAHGILSRVEEIRVKSMGIVMLLVPIAAFVEPDDDELFGSEKQPAKASRLARVRILSAGVIANFITAAVAMALFFGPVMSAVSPIDRVVVADVENDSIAEKAGIARNMIVYDANGVFAKDLDELRSGINGGIRAIGIVGTTARLNVSVGDGDTDRQSIALNGTAERGILIVDTFDASPARAAGMPERFVITGLEGVPIAGMEDFRARMNLTRPGQDLLINTNRGDYTVKLAEKGDGTGLIGISISGDALYMSGAIFQQFPASAFLGKLKQMPSSGIIGFYSFMTLPFTGIPGFTENGFQEFGGWISHFFEPDGWAEPIGGRIFWIANALLWIGWINLYAGLFNSLPAIPLDGGHIFRDVVQGTLERFVNVGRAERITRSVVSGFAWLIFASLFLSIAAPYMAHGLPI